MIKKILLIIFIILTLVFEFVAFNIDNLDVIKFFLNIYLITLITVFVWIVLFVYFVFYGLIWLYRYLHNFFKKHFRMKSSYDAFYTFIYICLVYLLVKIFTGISGYVVLSSHRCINNDTENCRIDTETLKSIYIPAVITLDKSTENFIDDNTVYFSAVARK